MKIRIGTRGSDLALWQAHTVAGWLRAAGGVEVELIVLKTRGDTIDDVPLSTVGGKDFFTAEIERALLDRSVDVAVHSHKDLATENPPGLQVVGVPERGPDRERLLVRPEAWQPEACLLPLAHGATVGTSAPRRREQLLALRPDLEVRDLRGNVPTRVKRLIEGRYDAIVLAAAGLERLALDLSELEVATLERSHFVPAPAQGALAIQVRVPATSEGPEREFDRVVAKLVTEKTHHGATERAIAAERRVLSATGGGCSLPLGANLTVDSTRFALRAFLGADQPTAGALPRWVDVRAKTPESAAEDAVALLRTQAPTGVGPLGGTRVAVCGSGEEGLLQRRLVTLGATVISERVLAFETLEAPELAARLAALQPGDGVAVTSPRAARALAGLQIPSEVTLAAVGNSTAKTLAELGHSVQVVGSGGGAELARELPLSAGATVLCPAAQDARPELRTGLEQRGLRVESIATYATRIIPPPERVEATETKLDYRVFTSPSAVRAMAEQLANEEREHPSSLALGRTTWEALHELNLASGPVPSGSGPEAVIAELVRLAPASQTRVWT